MIERSHRGQSRWLALVSGLCALLLAACLETPAVQCADGRVCPAGRACDDVHGGCVLPGQLAECEGQANETPCSFQGEPNGACFDGVCFPAGCGNGELEEGEVCDDGNTNNGDNCSADCTSDESCGNGVIDFLTEGCDDGKHCQSQCDDGTPCAADSECADIGDETCNLGASCDDDSECAGVGDGLCRPRDGDGCQSNCIPSTCGDGVVDFEFNEACDLGADNADDPDATCRTNCQPRRCGDQIVDEAAGENCDDGNLFPGDGCSGACVVEECGNNVVDLEEVDGSFLPSEECDDGENNINHDGCAPACSREQPMWTGPPPVFPSPRNGHAMAYDAARGRVVLVGGFNDNFAQDGETWEYRGQRQAWTQVPVGTPDAPSPRRTHAMAYDAKRGRVVLFGGFDGERDGETWEYDGATRLWTQVPVASPDAPSPRDFHAMAYDAARGKVVLFGGAVSGGFDGETWEYDGATQTWTQVPVASPDAPSPRNRHAMVYDAARGKVVLFGGFTGSRDGETWEYDGATQTWTQVPVASPDAPSPRNSHAMAYDAARQKVVLFGGTDGTNSGETWEYDGATQSWTQVPIASPDAPSARNSHAMAYDIARQKVVLFGGFVDGLDGETWEYDGATQTWTQVPVATPNDPSPRHSHAMAQDDGRGKVVLFGGTDADGRDGETWEHDASTQTWTQVPVASPDAPGPRSLHAMAYDAARQKVVLFGGTDGGFDGETWEYDVATQTWTQVPVASPDAPSPRHSHAMAYDAARGTVVLFGGNAGSDDGETWEYDGQTQTWTQVPVASPDAPRPRQDHAMAYDVARKRVVLFGGTDAGGLDGETWEYDGAAQSWTLVSVSRAPSPRKSHAMAYDAARGRIVLFGGADLRGQNGETWEYDGSIRSWSQLAVASPASPSPRRFHAMAYESVGGNIVLFGGIDPGQVGETWTFQHTSGIDDACTTGFDGDADGLIGCDDPDCWGHCTPHCPASSATDWPNDCDPDRPRCGDGECNAFLETPRLCPGDCGPPAAVCGDFHCDNPEDAASCPGDCTP